MPNSSTLKLVAVLEPGLFQVPGEVCEVTESYAVTRALVRLYAQIVPNDVSPIVVVVANAIDSDGHYALCVVLDPRIGVIGLRLCEGEANKIGAFEHVRI